MDTAVLTPAPPHRWPPSQGQWTYADYARLPDDGPRYEVIGGELTMTPAPRPRHQEVTVNLTAALHRFVRRQRLGKVYAAPIDVNLPGRASPVQPDVLFIAKHRLDIVKERFVEGAPDLIVEVLSPGSVEHDRQTKFYLYASAGVREYWVVDPETCLADIYVLRGSAYALLGSFAAGATVQSEVLPDLALDVDDFCQE